MKIKLLIILGVMFIIGCNVKLYKVYQLRPNYKETIWLNGNELVKIDNESIELIINFDRISSGIAYFDLAINNYSENSILISPETFYYNIYPNTNKNNRIYAIDPAKYKYELNKRTERIYTQKKSDNTSNLVLSLFDMVETFSGKNKTEEQKRIQEEKYESRMNTYETRQIRHNSDLDRIETEKDKIEQEFLQKTTLFSKQQINGKILFPIPEEYNEINLVFELGENAIEVSFMSIDPTYQEEKRLFYTINLKDENILQGQIIKATSKKLYLKNNKTLTIIPRKKIEGILNDDEEISYKKIKSIKNGKVNFNSFTKIINL
ncbi:MAG: hypothetical protein K8S23_04375 [Candidatus Cloacimonetes bacterium]|nr:hypothetical protein [Candidatus Cloacimonadota bacterium]